MVFFNCNACGEALKKNQVDKHVLRCRHCEVLSCVDCGKDFWGNDYQTHTKCMTEEEKYCGQGYVPKVNKGEAKQEQWIERVQGAIAKASSPGLKGLLVRLKDYPNIPRKQQKFQNFLKNSLRVYSDALITQVWDILMAHAAQNAINKGSTENGVSKQETKEISNGNATSATDDKLEADEVNGKEPKKSKREKKEERRDKCTKKEKKDRVDPSPIEEEQVKKSKKRKLRDQAVDEDQSLMEGKSLKVSSLSTEEHPPKKKKKKKHSSEDSVTGTEKNDINDSENRRPDVEESGSKKKTKFNWETTITQVLETKGEISLKKLRKKVLSEFAALDSANYSEENLWAKFDKKVRKMSNVQVFKERAKLKED